jgi:hypothetical protein
VEHPVTLKEFLKNGHDKWWRINNLYFVLNEEGERVIFKARWAQEVFFMAMWTMNIILKARQLGFTTLIQIMALDECLFNQNFESSIIAHGQKQSKDIFRRKIKFPYDNLPEFLKRQVHLTTDSKEELAFSNGSIISVATSIRSGTVQFLHISEHGKICRKFPDKAEEIRTGSLNAIHAGQIVIIESTAEGQHGDFFEYCQEAMRNHQEGNELTQLDFKFHFYPWYEHPEYEFNKEDTARVTISDGMKEYFRKLHAENPDINLSPGQMAWYAKKAEKMLDKMKQEFPSTPQEAFEQSIEGAIYGKQMTSMREEGRITDIPYDEYAEVHTAWDLGRSVGNAMAVWFFQVIGMRVQVIDYLQAEDEDFIWFKRRMDEKPYKYGYHAAPHDINVTDIVEKKKRIDRAAEIGLNFTAIPRTDDLFNAVQKVKRFFPNVWIDKTKCDEGIKCLDNYIKKWNDNEGRFSDTPLHNWASNGADAFRTMENLYEQMMIDKGYDDDYYEPDDTRDSCTGY